GPVKQLISGLICQCLRGESGIRNCQICDNVTCNMESPGSPVQYRSVDRIIDNENVELVCPTVDFFHQFMANVGSDWAGVSAQDLTVFGKHSNLTLPDIVMKKVINLNKIAEHAQTQQMSQTILDTWNIMQTCYQQWVVMIKGLKMLSAKTGIVF